MQAKKYRVLYQNFLQNYTIYRQSEAYWERQINPILASQSILFEPWLNTRFANGIKMCDGNPIYNTKLGKGKALRVIQEEVESDNLEITAWINKTVDENNYPLKELVISLGIFTSKPTQILY